MKLLLIIRKTLQAIQLKDNTILQDEILKFRTILSTMNRH
jgi:hypothetical protein